MRIRAISVFEGVVYHCWPVDLTNPGRPTLEVEAILRPGDADAEAGPLLLPVADYILMLGGIEQARPYLRELQAKGRIVERLGVDHLRFPTWTRIPVDPPVGPTTDDDDRDAVDGAGATAEGGPDHHTGGDLTGDDGSGDAGAGDR